jgi:hypothetical protein
MPFDPSAPQSARWRAWLNAALADRGIPPNASLEMQLRPCGEAPIVRLLLVLRWMTHDAPRHARSEVVIPVRRFLGEGWPGWPAYLAALRLLRALG